MTLENWLGREGSNLRMAESKSAALPLGYAPMPRPRPRTGRSPETSRQHKWRTPPLQARDRVMSVARCVRFGDARADQRDAEGTCCRMFSDGADVGLHRRCRPFHARQRRDVPPSCRRRSIPVPGRCSCSEREAWRSMVDRARQSVLPGSATSSSPDVIDANAHRIAVALLGHMAEVDAGREVPTIPAA